MLHTWNVLNSNAKYLKSLHHWIQPCVKLIVFYKYAHDPKVLFSWCWMWQKKCPKIEFNLGKQCDQISSRAPAYVWAWNKLFNGTIFRKDPRWGCICSPQKHFYNICKFCLLYFQLHIPWFIKKGATVYEIETLQNWNSKYFWNILRNLN